MSAPAEPISVSISGPFGCGKTAVHAVISKALREFGYRVENRDCEPEKYLEQLLSARLRSFTPDRNDGRTVIVESEASKAPQVQMACDREPQPQGA